MALMPNGRDRVCLGGDDAGDCLESAHDPVRIRPQRRIEAIDARRAGDAEGTDEGRMAACGDAEGGDPSPVVERGPALGARPAAEAVD